MEVRWRNGRVMCSWQKQDSMICEKRWWTSAWCVCVYACVCVGGGGQCTVTPNVMVPQSTYMGWAGETQKGHKPFCNCSS